jgi:sigma-E factor negative regulatory protein RseC
MVQNAIVKKIMDNGLAQVSLLRQMECGLHCDQRQCAACGQKPQQEILAFASNSIGAQPGDHVEVAPCAGNSLSAPFLVFILPCVGLGAGYILGQSVLGLGEIAALGAAAFGLVAGFLPAIWRNRSILRRGGPEFSILKLLR